ncbi:MULTISPECIES: TetR/AcrR family transcriptional regulator [unclassified Mycobacterium]|uniref:TetR/AcrR family transcriptional regulator n=1 Tax=unclassified Mycobacterium TaxID=2642494 RepID=UPI00073FB2FC|nr:MULTISPECIES: TetR/AcrR family transcriptional regulator [unclassified Mycobacterium]KUH82230.1 TetR family transcriptional regulator [Mycobacterium sp. GA-0227b]KUH90087.1 TetR family transcriptional regulator [Mycobacterium sp. GA-1999]KUH94967.1 TetR family transcriptional regulator [Mycobacterium sp. IS-1556]
MAQVRPYRGVDAAERLARRRRRLLEAGLDLLGAGGNDPAELTVRAICGAAGLGVRYFYESFTDKDDFVAAVFDSVVADIAATTQAAVASAPSQEQSRAGMANVVRAIAADARVGRLLFSVELSNTVIVRKRAESTALFAMLLLQHAGTLGAQDSELTRATAHFAVGGVGQTLSAWLAGNLEIDSDQLVDRLAVTLDVLSGLSGAET